MGGTLARVEDVQSSASARTRGHQRINLADLSECHRWLTPELPYIEQQAAPVGQNDGITKSLHVNNRTNKTSHEAQAALGWAPDIEIDLRGTSRLSDYRTSRPGLWRLGTAQEHIRSGRLSRAPQQGDAITVLSGRQPRACGPSAEVAVHRDSGWRHTRSGTAVRAFCQRMNRSAEKLLPVPTQAPGGGRRQCE